MEIEFTAEQRRAREAFRALVDRDVMPHVDRWDQEELMPPEAIALVARVGYLGAAVPAEYGGLGLDTVTHGLLHEELGRGCSSLRSLLTVHGMVAHALARWGTREQRDHWLPRLARGEVVAAFALTEPNVGCDARHVETTAVRTSDGWSLSGTKRWITFGQTADLFLVFAQSEGAPTAFLVERQHLGLSVRALRGLLGLRASMCAELVLDGCRVPSEAVVGRVGFGFSHVASCALDLGRYTVAWGSVGIGQACLEASLAYATRRRQFGAPLLDHQLVQEMVTNMVVGVKAARLLCCSAGYLRGRAGAQAASETTIAKYFASTVAVRVASDAVQIHGANGCGGDYPVQRYLRDAKVMEIIEGSSQMQQIMIARQARQATAVHAL
jgi:glutaryl-CoA dehydrogenase (non-decarboxylating)